MSIIRRVNGADFGKLRMLVSADQQALNGGRWAGAVFRDCRDLAQALSTAKKGDDVGPIRSGVGFHILKVNDLRGEAIWVTEVHARHMLKPSPVNRTGRVATWNHCCRYHRGVNDFALRSERVSQDPGSANPGVSAWATPGYFRSAPVQSSSPNT